MKKTYLYSGGEPQELIQGWSGFPYEGKDHIYLEMYTIQGDSTLDLAIITLKADGSPVQHFTKDIVFCDIMVEGKATFVAEAPDGTI
ncbi:MAG: hypothetical protein Q9M91_00855 [Candidatus Dojkabacteria bacterium]|nr:hypothetical protein [Candidatus Dojkabacteria bacterium]